MLLAEEWGVAKAFPNRWCGECFQLEVVSVPETKTDDKTLVPLIIYDSKDVAS